MPSWREQASAGAQADLDALADAALSTAERALSDSGEFYPFAVVRTVDGESAVLAVSQAEDHPDSEAVVAELWGALQDQRDELRAAGVVSDRVLDGQDQVAVMLEHREGTALQLTLGYRVEGGAFEPGTLQAGPGVARIW